MCKHPNGLVTLTPAQLRAELGLLYPPSLWIVHGSTAFVMKRCGCQDAAPVSELPDVYEPLALDSARRIAGLEGDD